MKTMTLGLSLLASSRLLIQYWTIFGKWENETVLDDYLKEVYLRKNLSNTIFFICLTLSAHENIFLKV